MEMRGLMTLESAAAAMFTFELSWLLRVLYFPPSYCIPEVAAAASSCLLITSIVS